MDDLEQRVAMLVLQACVGRGSPHDAAAAIIPMVLEEAAKVAHQWVADDIEGKRLADLIRAIGGE